MGSGSDEWNKGYFGGGTASSPDAQDGQWARQRDDAARDARLEQARQASLQPLSSGLTTLPVWQSPSEHAPSAPSAPAVPATLASTVKGCAVAGGVLALAYAYAGLGLTAWPALLVWGVKGLAVGAAGGVALYAAIVVLRVVFAVLAVVLKITLWIGLAVGVIYLLGQVR